MSEVRVIGLDIAKSVFQLHGVDGAGATVLQKRLTRARLLPFFEKLSPCLWIGTEVGPRQSLAKLMNLPEALQSQGSRSAPIGTPHKPSLPKDYR